MEEKPYENFRRIQIEFVLTNVYYLFSKTSLAIFFHWTRERILNFMSAYDLLYLDFLIYCF